MATGTTLANQFDGLSPSGTVPTTANSKLASGWPFDVVSVGTGASLASSAAQLAHPADAFSLKVSTGSTATTAYVSWTTSLGTQATVWWRVYCYLTANPPSAFDLVRFSEGSGTNLAGAVRITGAGNVSFTDTNGAQQLISATTVPLNQWFRLEGFITGSATAGQAGFRSFFAADSAAENDSGTTTATLDTAGAITGIRFGVGNSTANVGPFWITDVGVSTGGWMGPLYTVATRVGASVYNAYYGSSQAEKGTTWDGILGRDMASPANGVTRCYYTEGDNPADDSQNVVGQATSGVKCCITFRPWRDGTNAYTGTVPGQGVTYATEYKQIQQALQLYFDNGIQASQIEVVLWHEANIFGQHGPFGDGTSDPGLGSPYPAGTTAAEAEANYAAYVAYYAPAVAQFGVKLTYVPSLSSNNNVAAFFPGTVTPALGAYFSTVGADFYYVSGASLANSAALATAWGLKLAMWEWSIPVDGSVAVSDVVTWITGAATAGGQILQAFLSFQLSGGVVADLIFFNGSGGGDNAPDNFKPTTSASILTAMHTLYDSLAVYAASAAITGTFTMTASGQDVSGTTHYAGATLTARFTLSPTGTRHVGLPSASILATFTLVTSGGAEGIVLQQVQGASALDYGLSTVEISTQDGSTLVVLAGWDLSTSGVPAPMPAVWVADSAGNKWYHVDTSSSGVTGARCSGWYCPNAMPVEWLTVAMTTFGSALAYTVLELDGTLMPEYFSIDVVDAVSAYTQALGLQPGVTADDDFAFAVVAAGGYFNPPPVVYTDTAWQLLNSVTTIGITGTPTVNQVTIFPYIQSAVPGTNLATTFELGRAAPIAALVFAVRSTTYAPYQPDITFPALQVEAAFGTTPGDPSQAPPTDTGGWTDITSRCMSKDGEAFIKAAMGHAYELASPETGTLNVACSNLDGALTPSNISSPFYPNITLETPVRVSAWWDGQWYALAFGWVERWPQQWPDLPQVGMSKMTAKDALGQAAAVTLYSAMDADALLSAPYVHLACAEEYLSFSNGLDPLGFLGSYTPLDAQGLPAVNISRTNQRNGMYVDGVGLGGAALPSPAIASTGATTNLLGSAGTGFGTDAFSTTAPTGPVSGPGIIYYDAALPDPADSGGVTVAFGLIIPSTVTSTDLQPTVFTAYGPPSSYRTRPSLTVQVLNYTGSALLQVTLADGSTVSAPFSPQASAQRVALCLTPTALQVYVNGGLAAVSAFSGTKVTEWTAVAWGSPNYAYGNGNLTAGNFTIFGCDITAGQVPAQRIQSQYVTAISGQQNTDACTRVAQILSWAGLGLPRSGRTTFSGQSVGVLQGPAYDLGGQTAAAALAQVAVNEQGMVCAQPGGELNFIHRWALLNQQPVCTFGDSTDPGAGEIPYSPGQSFGFDDSYLFTSEQVTLQNGPNTLLTAAATNYPAQQSYFPRTPATTTIETMSGQDAIDQANWGVAKYSQPQLRVASLTVDLAALAQNYPSLVGTILSLRQGQVATVIRRPMGGAVIQQNVLIQKITHSVGGKLWKVGLQMSPYTLEGAVLQLDAEFYDVIGNNSIA